MTSLKPDRSVQAGLLPWIVWGLACLFYFYEFLLQVSPSVMSYEIMRDFNVTSKTLGILSGIYFYSYAIMQLPGGMLMDYYGPHKIITIAALVCAISTLSFSLTQNFYMACFARLMIGFGSAFACVGSMKFAANWFPAERFALLTGIMITVGMLGAIFGEAPLALLIDRFGWRETMIFLGFAGLFIALLIFLIAHDEPKTSFKKIAKKTSKKPILSLWPSFKKLLANNQVWLIAIYGGLMYLSTPVFCGLWGVPFLMLKMHISKALAAKYISMVFVGWAIGGPLWGFYSNHIGLRKPPLYIGSIGGLISCCFFIYFPVKSAIIMQLLLLSFGFFCSGFLPSFALIKEICDKQYVATGLSFMNMMNMIGIALAQPIVGFILDAKWQGLTIDKVRSYPESAFIIALSFLPISIFAAFLLLPKIKETYCQYVVHKSN